MRTLFIGGTRRGYLTLKALVDRGADLVGTISLQQDPHETERFESRIRALCRELDIPCFESRWLKDRDYATLIEEEIRPDIAFVVGCRVLIGSEIYEIPPKGMLAVHDSLLPSYRGFAPLNWSILNGESRTGVTLFYLNDLIDGGDIVARRSVDISPTDSAPAVYERVCQATVDVVIESYDALERGSAPRVAQNGMAGTWTCSRNPSDGMIEWSENTRAIHNLIRGLTRPYPGAFTYLGPRKLYIWSAHPVEVPPSYVGRIPGKVVGIDRASGNVDVLTGDGVLRIECVALENQGLETRPAEIIRSVRTRLGVSTEDLLHRLHELESRVAALEQQIVSGVTLQKV